MKVFKKIGDDKVLDKSYFVRANNTAITIDGKTSAKHSKASERVPMLSESPYEYYDQGDKTSGKLVYSVYKDGVEVLGRTSVQSKTLSAHF